VPNANEDQLDTGLYTLDEMARVLGGAPVEEQARAVLALSFFDQGVILSGGVGPETKRVTDRMSGLSPDLIRNLASVGESQIRRQGLYDPSAADARRVVRDMKGASLAAAELLAEQRGEGAAFAYMEALERAAQDVNTKKATKAELANVARLLQLERPDRFRSWSAVPKAELKDLIEDQLDTLVNPTLLGKWEPEEVARMSYAERQKTSDAMTEGLEILNRAGGFGDRLYTAPMDTTKRRGGWRIEGVTKEGLIEGARRYFNHITGHGEARDQVTYRGVRGVREIMKLREELERTPYLKTQGPPMAWINIIYAARKRDDLWRRHAGRKKRADAAAETQAQKDAQLTLINPIAQPFTTATGTRSTLEALDAAGWGMLITPDSYRPARVEFALSRGMPLALDNGAFAAWSRGEDWEKTQREGFEKRAEELGGLVSWIVAPDIVAGGARSLELSEAWIPWLLERTPLVMLPVQDGMTPEDVAPVIAEHHPRVGIFLGGSTEWKWDTADEWGQLADAWGVPYHVARVNSLSAIQRAGSVGASSWDGTGPVQFPSSLERLERGHRQQTMALLDAGVPCCATPDLAEDLTGTWCVNCGEQTEPGAVTYSSLFPDVELQEEREKRRTQRANPVPPAEVAAVARRALTKRAASSKARPGGTAIGLARARDLANRRNLSEETLRRMVSFFQRHDGHQEREARKDPESPASVAWELWGGDPGRRWAIESLDRLGAS
jgi:hypothetical protein